MIKLVVVVFAFFGSLMVPPMFFPKLSSVAFTLGGFGISWVLLIALAVATGAMGLQAKNG